MKFLGHFFTVFLNKSYNLVGISASLAGTLIDVLANLPLASIAGAVTTIVLGGISAIKAWNDMKNDNKINQLEYEEKLDILNHNKKMRDLTYQLEAQKLNS